MNLLKNLTSTAKRFQTATALNLMGLTVAFAACYLFLTQVIYNHTYNTCFKDHDRLYRVEVIGNMWTSNWQAHIPRPLIADRNDSMCPVSRKSGHNTIAVTQTVTKGI